MSEVVKLFPSKDPDHVLEEAVGAYRAVVVLGWNHDDEMDIRADLNLSVADAHLLMAIAQRYLVDHMVDEEE